MPLQTEKDLTEKTRALWLKALTAVELRNYGYSISLIQAVLNVVFSRGFRRHL